MDKFSFLGATHINMIEEMYAKYLLGDADLDAMRAADAAGELDGGYQYGTDNLNGSPDQRQSNQYQAQ